MRIALAGNPNSGKTTMYNQLTGQSEQVGNWAGVTVEKKEHTIKKSLCTDGKEWIAVDLPGAYSMSPFTSEESVTRDYVKNEKPHVIIRSSAQFPAARRHYTLSTTMGMACASTPFNSRMAQPAISVSM